MGKHDTRPRKFERKHTQQPAGIPQQARWPLEHDAKLKQLAAAHPNYSAKQMACAMSEAFDKRFTRNMIIGRCRRLGVKTERKVETHEYRKARGWASGKTKSKRGKQSVQLEANAAGSLSTEDQLLRADGSRGESNTGGYRRLRKPEEIAAARIGSIPELFEECSAVGKPLLQTRAAECKWPMSDSDGLRLCGKSATIGSYCTQHARKAYRTMPTRGRNKIMQAQHLSGKEIDILIVDEIAETTIDRIALDGCKL